MAQKRKIDEDKENALTELAKKSKTSETNENEVKEADSNNPTTSAAAASNNEAQENLETPISNNRQVLATIKNTEVQTAVDDKTKEAQAEIDREKDLRYIKYQDEKLAAYYKRASDREQNFRALGERLQKAATSKLKTFSMSGEASEMPILLGLHVKGFGVVSLPLADQQATELIKLCKLSSRPQQAKKNVNTRRGNTKSDEASYELDADQIEIQNSEWNTELKELVSLINREYGVQLEAKLHKMEINKPGGHFIKYRNSEKDKRIVGTLIIQPPSTHTGGELVVYEANGKSKKLIDFGQKENKSKLSVQFAAYNADFEHELLEVKSGYRIALVYSLCWVTENEQLANDTKSSSANELSAILEKLSERPHPVALLLEHHYTPQSFQNKGALKVLKDVDNDRLKALMEANEALEPKKQQAIYMCKLTLEVKNKDENGYFDEVEHITANYYNHFAPLNPHLFKWAEKSRSDNWSDWQDLDGKPVFDSFTSLPYYKLAIDMKTGLDANLSQTANWGQPDTQTFDGYLIKKGVKSTFTYSKNMLVIWPKRFEFAILLKSDINYVINSVYKSVIVNEDKTTSSRQFETILNRAEYIKKLPDRMQLNEKATDQMLEILLKFNNLNYVKEFIGFQKPKLTSTNSHIFVKLISQFGYEPLKDLLELIIQPNVDDLIKHCQFIIDLYNEKSTQSAAAIFAKKCLIDIINNPRNATSIGNRIKMGDYFKVSAPWSENDDGNQKQQLEHIVITLVKMLQLFADQQTMESLEECMKIAFPGSVKWLLEEFGKEKISVRKCPALVKILEARQRMLNEKLKERPREFTWRMPQATLPSYKHEDVQEFLRSDLDEMIYSPPFRDEGEIESFIKNYQGFWNNDRHYSCKITKDSDTSVLIKKTKRMFEHTMKVFNEYESELGCIKTFIKNLY